VDLEDFRPVEPDPLLGEADPHEDEAARAHLEGAEPADLLDDELGPQRFGARFRVQSESEVTEAPQPCTVEAMCEANWPAQQRSTEAGAYWRGLAWMKTGKRVGRLFVTFVTGN
jgi:hypothetical protein